MTNRTVSPGDIFYFMRVLLFVALLSTAYALSRPQPAGDKTVLLPDTAPDPPENGWASMPSWQRKASEKAVARYAGAQQKKWRRWNEAMFERAS